MAVDTRNKRFSMMMLALPFGRVLPNPDGGFAQGDYEQLLLGYAGVQFSGPGDPRHRRWGGIPHMRLSTGHVVGRSW